MHAKLGCDQNTVWIEIMDNSSRWQSINTECSSAQPECVLRVGLFPSGEVNLVQCGSWTWMRIEKVKNAFHAYCNKLPILFAKFTVCIE